ncbi:hypothetical protein J4430_00205 [Candidatus Woesearchaeota archaeon]|nr:hypothetical protein [Candidatus Woesearchaeota archaeon]
MIELEKTYLAKELPKNLRSCKFKEIIDIYIPKTSRHPTLRIRKNGDKYEVTKKEPVSGLDSSCQEEQTIVLREDEFKSLEKIDGKRIRKLRYYYNYHDRRGEVDIFQDSLKGLVLVDFEFETIQEKDEFEMPNFCLVDITQEKLFAGGMLCGKSYEDIEENLRGLGYKKLFL